MSPARKTSGATIRRARPDDVSAMCQIEVEAFRHNRFSRRQFRYLVTHARGAAWVVTEDGLVLGFAIVLAPARWRTVRVYDLAIARAARGRGLGRLLIMRIWNWSLRQGRRRLTLEVEGTNRGAIHLYERLGFERMQRLADYYGRGRHGWKYVYAG